MARSKTKAKSVKQTVKRDAMSEGEAARACASMFVSEGIPEGDGPGYFEIVDVDLNEDGEYFAMIKVCVGNLDVELASNGTHIDQEKINAIHAEHKAVR